MRHILWVDFETFSDVDLGACGTYKYIESLAFLALLLSWAFDDDEVVVHDFTVNPDIPARIVEHIRSGGVVGSHSPFDFLILRKLMRERYNYAMTPDQMLDTVTLCAEYGIPLALKFAGEFLGCEEQKDPVGRLAIQTFGKMKRPKGEKQKRRILPEEEPELWSQFVQYCRGDLILMREVYHKLPKLSAAEYMLQMMTLEMNDRGIRLDRHACGLLSDVGDRAKQRLNEIMVETTDGAVQTIGQVAKIADFCGTTSAGEPALDAALKSGQLDTKQTLVAKLRLAGARSSAAKLPKMVQTTCQATRRSHGNFVFHGTVTGRWAGRQWQPHNLPRESFKPDEVDQCLDLAHEGYDTFIQQYRDPMKTISMCLRGMIIPEDDCELIIADYSQIEARVLVWYAGQWDIVQIYEEGGDVYKEMASAVYGVPISEVTADQRWIGKCLCLGSGYGLGWAGLQRSLARSAPASDDQAKQYTWAFRNRFDKVVIWWRQIVNALACAINGQGLNQDGVYPLSGHNLLAGRLNEETVYFELPTGKRQYYHGARITEEVPPWGGEPIPVIKARNPRGGGEYNLTHSILAENICSATAREILGRAMWRLDEAGYPPIMSVHDEVVLEVPKGYGSDAEVEQIMCQRPPWGKRIPLAIEMQRAPRYCK